MFDNPRTIRQFFVFRRLNVIIADDTSAMSRIVSSLNYFVQVCLKLGRNCNVALNSPKFSTKSSSEVSPV